MNWKFSTKNPTATQQSTATPNVNPAAAAAAANIDAINQILNIVLQDVANRQQGNAPAIMNIIQTVLNSHNKVSVTPLPSGGLSFVFSWIPGLRDKKDVTIVNTEYDKEDYITYDENGVKKVTPRLKTRKSTVTRTKDMFNFSNLNKTLKNIASGNVLKSPDFRYNLVLDEKFIPEIKPKVSTNGNTPP
jgi:hypothetical protein